jgi:hypothetical protein
MPVPQGTGGQFAPWMGTLSGIASHMNANIPGQGDQFIAWVNHQLATVKGTHVAEGTYPPNNNSPLSWYAAYILLHQLPDTIGAAVNIGVSAINPNQILTGFGKGVAQVPGATTVGGLSDFFSRLTTGAVWVRVGEVLVGIVLLGVGVSAMLKGTPAGNAAGSIAKTAKKVVK